MFRMVHAAPVPLWGTHKSAAPPVGRLQWIDIMTFPSDPADVPRGAPASRPDAADLLLRRRIVLADGHLDGARATDLSAKLMTLGVSGDDPIILHLRMPDGDLEAAFAVADAIT